MKEILHHLGCDFYCLGAVRVVQDIFHQQYHFGVLMCMILIAI